MLIFYTLAKSLPRNEEGAREQASFAFSMKLEQFGVFVTKHRQKAEA